MTPLAEGGATAAGSVADVADADIISVTVLNDAQVREVVASWRHMPSPAPSSRSTPRSVDTTAVELAQELKPQGIHIVGCAGQRRRGGGRQG